MSKLNKTQLPIEKQDARLSRSMQAGVVSKYASQDIQVHLCSESTLLFPLIYASSIAWNEQAIYDAAEQQYTDYFVHFYNFRQCLQNQGTSLTNAYCLAFRILDFLESKRQYKGKSAIFEAQITVDDRVRSNTNIKQTIRSLRKDVYLYRKELREIIGICQEPETPLVLQETENIREELTERYHQLVENMLPGLLFDDITVEMIYQYLVNQKNEGSDEVNLYNQVKTFSLAPFIPKFKALVYSLLDLAKSEFNQTQNILAKQQKLVQATSTKQSEAVHLYLEIPQLIDQYKVNLNQQCSCLPQTIQDDKEYLDYYQQNNELEQRILSDIQSAPTKNEQEQMEKNCLATEFATLVSQQQYFHDIFIFLKSIPDLIEKLRSINLERVKMWKELPEKRNIDRKCVQENQLQCQKIVDDINKFVAEGKIPFKFLQVQLQAQYEVKQLQKLLDYDLSAEHQYNMNLGLMERVQELLKWEYSGEQAQGENAEINKYLIEAFELNIETKEKVPPPIEEEINSQLEQNNPENINDMMELNENYTIWKNMQAAGIYLNEDYLSQILNNVEKLPLFSKKMEHLLKFFSLNDQKMYTEYIKDVLQLIKLVQLKQIEEAKQFIQNSKIPKQYRNKIISELKPQSS